jgi:hypothetical protein
MKRVYIAGPMTGLPDHNFPAFHAMAAQLRAQGLDAVNPAEINAGKDGAWADYMRADIAQLVTCDSLMLLPGWERSRGAKLEFRIAVELGMTIEAAPGESPFAQAAAPDWAAA